MMAELGDVVNAFAHELSPELQAAPDKLGSLLAQPLIACAWSAASRGKVLAGKGEPDPEKFAKLALKYAKSMPVKDAPRRFIMNTETGGWKELSSREST